MQFSKRMRARLGALLSSAALIAAAGCSAGQPTDPGGTAGNPQGAALSIAVGADPINLDPRLTWVGQGYSINAHLFEPLVFRQATADGGVELFPLLAESWQNRDELTWEFTLRGGITFHNGEPFNAAAVVFTLTSVMDEAFETPLKTWTASIDTVKAEDDTTVVITTKTPTRGLLNSLAQLPIVSPQAVEEFGEEFTLNPVGTGPYSFVSYTPGSEVRLQRFDEYWGEPGTPGTITWRVMPESSSRLAALESGEVQIAENIPPDQLPVLEANPEVKMLTSPTMRVDFMVVNFVNPIMDDVRFREGLSLAIDRGSLVEQILAGTTQVANSVSPPGTVGYDAELEPFAYDLDRATQLIRESGYDGGPIRVGAPVGRYSMDSQIGEAIAGMLTQAGVNVQFEALPWSEYNTRTADDAYDLFFLGQTDFTLYPTAHWTPLFSCGSARGHYCNEEITAKIAASAAILDDTEAAKAYAEIQGLLYDEYAALPLYWEPQLIGTSAGISGFTTRLDEYVVATKAAVA